MKLTIDVKFDDKISTFAINLLDEIREQNIRLIKM